jgi:predicted nucleic-acid-binding protein
MIAIDTNVLLRYLLWDDVEQAKRADKLINAEIQVLVTDIVLIESIWTLKGKKYKLDKEGIVSIVSALFEEKNICFDNPQVIWHTLNDYINAKVIKVGNKNNHADFADALIVNKAKYYAIQNNKELEGVYTFDKAAQLLNGMKEL